MKRNAILFEERINLLMLVLSLFLVMGISSHTYSAENWPPPLGKEKIIYLSGPYDSGQSVSNLGKVLLEQMGYKVDYKVLDTGLAYQALAGGTGDVWSAGYLPGQQPYLNKFGDKIDILAPSYGPVIDGIAVPGYVPLTKIEDLKNPDIKKRLGGKIIGIDAGSGTMLRADKAMKAYNLDYELIPASTPAMEAAFRSAYAKGEWVVVIGWCPTPMCSKYNVKFLQDSKGVFPDCRDFHILRRGFRTDFPLATVLLSRLSIYVNQLSEMVVWIGDEGLKPEQAARRFIERNPELVWWWAGDLIPGLKKPDSLK